MLHNLTKGLYLSSICIILLLLPLFFSCSDSSLGTEGSLQLSLRSEERFSSRNIDPAGSVPLKITSFMISGTGPDAQVLDPITSEDEIITIHSLLVGDWDFNATGFNSTGTPIASGSTSLHVSNQNNTAQIVLDSEVGTGTFNLVCNWNPVQTTVDSTISVTLLDLQGNPVEGVIEQVDFIAGTAEFEAQLAAGYYSVLVNLQTDGEIISGFVETLRIIDQTTSQATRMLEIGKVIDSGTISIIDTTTVPIEGTITITPSQPSAGEAAVLEFVPQNPIDGMTVQWYREGVPIAGATTNELSIPAVDAGTYRYDIVVSIPLIGSVGSAGALVSVPITPTVL